MSVKHWLFAVGGVALGLSAAGAVTLEGDRALLVEFSPSQMAQWETHSFSGETRYRLVSVDGRDAVHARCSPGHASGLIHGVDIDLEELPIIEWSWRVDETPVDVDETTRSGDDFAARVYVVKEHRLLRWRTRAVNYVWAARRAAGADWPNPYSSQAHMVAVRSGPSKESDGWRTERRNVRRDFREFHGRELDRITHVAIMTDCDDTERTLEAWYGGIRFLPR